ncbi:hypothetical protein FHS59_002738 [Algoriphagus iocasae]|uniref:DNA-binding protein n=2 Tax=Algoriphagus iocasae TaxID=1836499 RepID=A0A841MI94_9BACT|nr:hypothetical protein [Algoriphagus iocasae]
MSPAQVEQLIANSVAKGIQMALGSNGQKSEPLPPTIPLKKAAEISGKTPNALRVQISIGNLKCMHRGSRIYLDTDYFQRWLRGEDEPESNPLEILK